MGEATTLAFGSRASAIVGSTPIVFIVDDDISVRESLEGLIADCGWKPEAFASANEFLARPPPQSASCVLLDVSLPDLNGLEVQSRIGNQRRDMPIIFITGHGDIPMTVRAMKAGAVEFLTKPFTDDVLINAVRSALARSSVCHDEEQHLKALHERYTSLSPREHEVMALVVRGRLNKQIGGELGISEITVKAHRGRVMRKMCAKSLAELVNMAGRLGLETAGKS